jgi:hypothetical protein
LDVSVKLNELQAALSAKEAEAVAWETTASEKAAAVNELEAVLSAKSAEVVALETTTSEKIAAIEELEATMSAKSAEVTALETATSEKAAAVNELEAALSVKSAEVTALEADALEKDANFSETMRKTLAVQAVDKDAQVAELEAVTKELEAAKESLASVQANGDSGLSEAKGTIAALEKAGSEAAAKVQQLEEGIAALSADRSSLELVAEKTGAMVSELEATVLEKESALSALTAAAEETAAQLAAARDEGNGALAIASARVQELEGEKETALQDKARAVADKEEAVQSKEQEVEELKAREGDLRVKVKAQFQKLKESLSNAEQQRLSETDALEEQRLSETGALKEQLEAQREELEMVRQSLQDHNHEQLITLQTALEDTKRVADEDKAALEAGRTAWSVEKQALEEGTRILEEDKAAAEEGLSTLRQKVKLEFAKLKEALVDAEERRVKDTQTLQEQLEAQKEELEVARTSEKDALATLEERGQDLEDTRSSLSSLEVEKSESWRVSNHPWKQELTELKASLVEERAQWEEERAAWEEEKHLSATSEKALSDETTTRVNELEQQLKDVTESLQAATAKQSTPAIHTTEGDDDAVTIVALKEEHTIAMAKVEEDFKKRLTKAKAYVTMLQEREAKQEKMHKQEVAKLRRKQAEVQNLVPHAKTNRPTDQSTSSPASSYQSQIEGGGGVNILPASPSRWPSLEVALKDTTGITLPKRAPPVPMGPQLSGVPIPDGIDDKELMKEMEQTRARQMQLVKDAMKGSGKPTPPLGYQKGWLAWGHDAIFQPQGPSSSSSS